MPLTDQGLDVPRAADILEQIRAELDVLLGVVVDYDRDLLLDSLTAIMATRVGDIADALQAVYDARDPSNATGDALSSLALAIGVVREAATATVVTLQILGTEGTSVLVGRTVRRLPGGELFDIDEDVIIPPALTVDARAVARVPGATQVPADVIGDQWEIITPVVGWTGVTNTAAGVTGEDRETDDELRVRRQNSLQIGGSTSAAAMQAALLQLAAVQAVLVLENDDLLPVVVDGVSIDPHSIAVIIHPTLAAGDQEVIARLIYDNLAAGIDSNGSIVATVQGADLRDKTIRFDFSSQLTIDMGIQVVMEAPSISNPLPPSFAEVEPQIDAAMVAFGLALALGEDVNQLAMITEIGAIEGVKSVISPIGFAPSEPGRIDAQGDVVVLAPELAVFNAINIVDATP